MSVGREQISYVWQRKAVKNFNLRVRRDASVVLSSPFRVSAKEADNFIAGHADFIFKSVARVKGAREQSNEGKPLVEGTTFFFYGEKRIFRFSVGEEEGVFLDGGFLIMMARADEESRKQELFDRFVDGECVRVFCPLMEKYYPLFRGVLTKMPALQIKTLSSAWGSCTPAKQRIVLNRRLIEKPIGGIEYVVLHEFCHFVHPDHSPAFYRLLSGIMPDWKERKNSLYQTR